MESARPDPDDLLRQVEGESRQRDRGRLKVFFGACAGVGKTYSMLEAARALKAKGVDVVAGWVETHGRAETDALLQGLEILPPAELEHRAIRLREFDLTAALVRRPALMLVDELAHTNAPGSRHHKRWKDVEELCAAGIDVYTSLNVQHLDSLNDVVAQITGIAVQETIPDAVLDQADEIELVDLPISDLLKRMEDGKVYVPEQAGRALASFFRPGNLNALREMALRRTADRVDAQMLAYRQGRRITATWPANERLMVCVGPSPFSARLVRNATRMASRLGADWLAVYVETPEIARQSQETRERILSTLRLAERLGAETVTLSASRVSDALLAYAKSRNVTKIIIGKPVGPLWKRVLRQSLIDEVIEGSDDIEILAIRGDPAPPAERVPVGPPRNHAAAEFLFPAAVVGVCTAISLLLRPWVEPTNLAMVYLLGVVWVARRAEKWPSVAASVVSVAAFDVFCIPPYYTFRVHDYEYVITLAAMLVVALLISRLSINARAQAAGALERERNTRALYQLSRSIAEARTVEETARIAAETTGSTFQAKVAVFLGAAEGGLNALVQSEPGADPAVAQWVFDHRQAAGRGTETLPGSPMFYLPLRTGPEQVIGVVALATRVEAPPFTPEQYHLLEAFASQTAVAIERAAAAATAEQALIRAESEQMRSSLLSTVSHDLRTPLASITGAASSLLRQHRLLDEKTSGELLESIVSEADRLSRLVTNLLEMTRIESGAVEVHRDWVPVEEIVGTALSRLDRTLAGRKVVPAIPPGLPWIEADEVLMEQVFVNLIENAVKHTLPGGPIEITARGESNRLVVEVSDRGPGLEPGSESRIFEKFVRGSVNSSLGAGLGLAICRAIVTAHGGTISAANREGGGATFRIELPVREAPVVEGKVPEADQLV